MTVEVEVEVKMSVPEQVHSGGEADPFMNWRPRGWHNA